MNYLFGLGGRIGRGKFWLGLLIAVVLMLALAIGSQLVFGPAVTLTNADGTPVTDLTAAPPDENLGFNWTSSAALAVAFLLPMWIYLATGIKRAHDRNKSGWWFVLLLLPSLLASAFIYYRLGQSGFEPDQMLGDPLLLGALGVSTLFSLIFFLWWLVDLGILEGTEGDNKYGPDPIRGRDPMSA